MTLDALKALLASATPGPWRVAEHKGATEFGHPIECDWLGIDGADGQSIELADPVGKNATVAIAIVNAAPALIACAEALELLTRDVQDYEAWERPCYAVDQANAALKMLENA